MYNPESTRLLILVFFFMLAAIAGGMMVLPDDSETSDVTGKALYAGIAQSVKHSYRQSFVEQTGSRMGDVALTY